MPNAPGASTGAKYAECERLGIALGEFLVINYGLQILQRPGQASRSRSDVWKGWIRRSLAATYGLPGSWQHRSRGLRLAVCFPAADARANDWIAAGEEPAANAPRKDPPAWKLVFCVRLLSH